MDIGALMFVVSVAQVWLRARAPNLAELLFPEDASHRWGWRLFLAVGGAGWVGSYAALSLSWVSNIEHGWWLAGIVATGALAAVVGYAAWALWCMARLCWWAARAAWRNMIADT